MEEIQNYMFEQAQMYTSRIKMDCVRLTKMRRSRNYRIMLTPFNLLYS
jgi:hypothetical protein